MRTYYGGLISSCDGGGACRDWRYVGHTVFHVLVAALITARKQNQIAGRKVARVVVRDGHFHVVRVGTDLSRQSK